MKFFLYIFRDLLIGILPQKLGKYFIEPRDFVWLVHPRNAEDYVKKIPILKFFSEKTIFFITKHFSW